MTTDASSDGVRRLSMDEFAAVLEEVGSGTPRAAALAGHALLETVLKRVLLSHMVPLDATRPMAARSHTAYALGLISEDLRQDLTTISEIRNRFAHTAAPMTFDDVKVAEKCARLSGLEGVKDPRTRYNLAVGQLLARLLSVIGPGEKL